MITLWSLITENYKQPQMRLCSWRTCYTAKERWLCERCNLAEQEINNEPATTSQWAANWKNSLCNPRLIHTLRYGGVHARVCVRLRVKANERPKGAENVCGPREPCSVGVENVLMAPTKYHRKQKRTARWMRLAHAGSRFNPFIIKAVRKKKIVISWMVQNLVMEQWELRESSQRSQKGCDTLTRCFFRCIDIEVYRKAVMKTLFVSHFTRQPTGRTRSRNQFTPNENGALRLDRGSGIVESTLLKFQKYCNGNGAAVIKYDT